LRELVDREGSSRVLTVDMPSTDSTPPVRNAGIERDYAEHRAAVLGMLGADFPRLRDLEEIYQEAWAELLTIERRGEVVEHRRALLKKIAWRRAADATKRRRPDAIDPFSPALTAATDEQALPDEQAQLRLDGDALRLVVDSLDEQQAAVLKLRFDQQLTAREVQDQLGIGEKRLEAIITAAYKKIAAQLAVDEAGESRWMRRQRSLLLACELGIASSRQRRRAQTMVDRDPACRAMLHAMRTNLGDVAAVLPMPVLAEEHDRLRAIAGATSRLDELWASARQLTDRLPGRGLSNTGLVERSRRRSWRSASRSAARARSASMSPTTCNSILRPRRPSDLITPSPAWLSLRVTTSRLFGFRRRRRRRRRPRPRRPSRASALRR
jgi:RNA polymerase sigma factor (sigma-70 family)